MPAPKGTLQWFYMGLKRREACCSRRQHGFILLLKRPRLWFAAARCAVWQRLASIYFSRERERNQEEGIRRILVPSLSCRFEDDAPSLHLFCFVLSPSRRSWASCEWADVASLLDRRCFDHDFDVQPGFPPSGRKSFNDFERHNVSNPIIHVRFVSSPR